jgi:hypothetical protein
MRIYEDRYMRERLRFHVALRFIRLEARTQTIRYWTGLTDDRIRKLYRSYLAHCGLPLARHRGKSPQRVAVFLRSARLRRESSLLASLFRLLGALPAPPALPPPTAQPVVTAAAPARPSLQRAQLLCEAYELYRTLLGSPTLGFEHAVFLLQALLQAEELTLAPCPDCQALVLMDRWVLYPARCAPCAAVSMPKPSARGIDVAADDLPVPPALCKTGGNGSLQARHTP